MSVRGLCATYFPCSRAIILSILALIFAVYLVLCRLWWDELVGDFGEAAFLVLRQGGKCGSSPSSDHANDSRSK
jgi:hypothetical protein